MIGRERLETGTKNPTYLGYLSSIVINSLALPCDCLYRGNVSMNNNWIKLTHVALEPARQVRGDGAELILLLHLLGRKRVVNRPREAEGHLMTVGRHLRYGQLLSIT